MKLIAWCLIALFCLPNFCPLVQQTSARAQSTQTQLEDSDSFLQAASRPATSNRDHSREVENLLARMTVEEKVGQMTQLEIGISTSGQGNEPVTEPGDFDVMVGTLTGRFTYDKPPATKLFRTRVSDESFHD